MTRKTIRLAKRNQEFYANINPVSSFEIVILVWLQIAGYFGLMVLKEDYELLDWRYLPTIIVFKVIAISAYFISRKLKGRAGPLMLVILPVILLTGTILFMVIFIHFIPAFALSLLAIILPPYLIITFFPILSLWLGAILMAGELIALIRYNRMEGLKNLKQKRGFVYVIIYRYYYESHYSFLYILLTLPLFVTVILFILLVLGQEPDSIVKAFTESRDALFSKGACEKCKPTDINHYLCTIGAYGSHALVKPVRYGIRNNQKFPLTRQLMICNAFEEVLSKKFPRLQRFLRKGYDRLDIPVNRWSRNKALANFFYLATKPLEWFFLLLLYIFVVKPETLIQRQYLPGGNKLRKN